MTTTLPLLALVVLLSASLQSADVVRLQVTVVVTVATNGVASGAAEAATNTASEAVPDSAPGSRSPFGFAETRAAGGGTDGSATATNALAAMRLLKARRTPAPMPPTPFLARAGAIERPSANPAHLQARIEAMATASSRSAARTNLPLPMARSADGHLRRNE